MVSLCFPTHVLHEILISPIHGACPLISAALIFNILLIAVTIIELLATRGLWYTTKLRTAGGRAAEINKDALRSIISGLLAWQPQRRVSPGNCRKTNIGSTGQQATQQGQT